MRPNEVARAAHKSDGSRKGVQEKAAAIKVGRDSGRVKVFVRVRPLKPQEVTKKEKVSVAVPEGSSSIHISDPKHSYEKDFPFDHVFPSGSTNQEVCNTLCKPIVTSALNGFNGTLMAYGQTGSGKTYTLMAPDGIASGVVDRCFKRIMQDSKHDYKVSMSYLQIYQEKIYDLLNSTNKVDLNIREHPQKGVYVENLSEFVVRAPSEVMNLLAVGKKRLVFAETKMNRTSSRSHSVCMLLIERTLSKEGVTKPKDCVPNERKSTSKEPRSQSLSRKTASPKKSLSASFNNSEGQNEAEEEEHDSLAKMTFTDDVLVRGRIHLCDLAGSERLKKTHAEGERLSEAQHINLSLLELGNVIHALADGSKTHVPFRNSTLTRLLQESLGGNCKTSLIVDYKKLSDDLTKMLNTREKDMDDLRVSYENRIEKVRQDVESQIGSSLVAAQDALSSVRSLLESKENEFKDQMEKIEDELKREKNLSSELRDEMSSLSSTLCGGVHRAKTALLAELLSMQLFYTIKNIPEEERQHLVDEIPTEHLYSGKQFLNVREKVLQNTENVLPLLEYYIKVHNNSGKGMEGLNLKDLEEAVTNGKEIGDFGSYDSGLDQSEQSWNKTDDDKVKESDKTDGSQSSRFLSLTGSLLDKLACIKGSLDSDSIEFLKKAFSTDPVTSKSREQVYHAMVEFLKYRQPIEDTRIDSASVPMLKAEMALLDQSLCHVLVDKALVSSLLLLEQSEAQKHVNKLSENNDSLHNELEAMKTKVETLVNENSKLNSKLSETSNFLQDVKSSKETLENDLSSVFQLYNMRSPEKKLNKDSQLKDGISTLVEENEKLKLELKDTQDEKRDLQIQLKNTKDEFHKLSKTIKATQSLSSTSTQTETSMVDGCTQYDDEIDAIHNTTNGSLQTTEDVTKKSPNTKEESKDLVNMEQFLINLQDELVKLEDDDSALFSHANHRKAISSLRVDLDKRIGELRAVEAAECKTLRNRVDELTIKLESSTYDYEKQIDDLETELENESKARLSLENELLVYRKKVMDLGAEIRTMCSKDPVEKHALSEQSKTNRDVQHEIGNYSTSNDIVDGLSTEKGECYLTEMDINVGRDELDDVKKSLIKVNQDLLDSSKEKQKLEEKFLNTVKKQQQMEEKYINLVNDNKVITLKFQAAEDKNKTLEEQLLNVTTLKTTLQVDLQKLKDTEHSHLEDIRTFKEKIATNEVEKTRLKQELSKTEIKFTTMDNKYKELNNDLLEAKKLLKETQMRLKYKEREVSDLHDAYDRLRKHFTNDESDRESLVEVKMKNSRPNSTPSRIQSIHLVSRAKSPGSKKKQPTYLASKKKMSIKRSPRNDESLTRKNTLKRGTLGKRDTLNNSKEHGNLARVETKDRDSIKRHKEKRTLKRNTGEDEKLKSELLLAKEQLLRLKGELTLSNIQTTNLGTHLTSLREDSNKLEVELSSLRSPSKAEGPAIGSRESNHLTSELESAKEETRRLQDVILELRHEKAIEEEKIEKTEEESKQLRSELYKTRDGLERSQEVVKILNKEIELLKTKNQILQHRLTSYTNEETEIALSASDNSLSDHGPTLSQAKLAQYEQEKARLEKEVEQLSNEKTKYEDMQYLVQQLVEIEDEQTILKNRLRKVVKETSRNDESEAKFCITKENAKSRKQISQQISQISEQSSEKKLEEYYIENTALRCEVDALRIYISNLENENKTVKYKLSISESSHSKSDKKVLATLLASAKHEREELRETLNNVYSEKEDMEESLNVARVKSERLQRELFHVLQSHKELEKELDSLKKSGQTVDKEKPSASLSIEERSVVDLIRKFLSNVGSRNVKEKDIKDFARTLLARKIHLNGKNTKHSGLENKQPWNSGSSMNRNTKRDSLQNNKTQILVNRQATSSPIKASGSNKSHSTNELRRLKPGTDRGTPEGMEQKTQAPSTKSVQDIKIFNSIAKLDEQSNANEVKDDLSLIYLDVDSKDNESTESEVLIKRAWSLKDLFKRNAGANKDLIPQS